MVKRRPCPEQKAPIWDDGVNGSECQQWVFLLSPSMHPIHGRYFFSVVQGSAIRTVAAHVAIGAERSEPATTL